MVEAARTGKENQMTITNSNRAESALKAVEAYTRETKCAHGESLIPLLCDLMHFADGNTFDLYFDFQICLDRASARYRQQCAEENRPSAQIKEYMAYFQTTAGGANDVYQAETPDQTLRIAQEVFERDDESLGFTPGDCPELQEIRIVTEDAEEVLIWQTHEYRLQLAAPKLLKVLQRQIEITREIIDAWNNTDHLYSAVEDLISELDSKSQWAQEVLRASERCDLTAPIEDLEKSLADNLSVIAQATGGAA
jgi:hypothetical protein